MNRPRICINSTVVDKIDLKESLRSEIKESISQCVSGEVLPTQEYTPFLAAQINDINKRLQRVEELLLQFGLIITPVQIEIVKSQNEYFSARPKKIIISEDVFKGKYFEKALIYNVVLNNRRNILAQFNLQQEIKLDLFADLLFFLSQNGNIQVDDFLVNKISFDYIKKFQNLSLQEKYRFSDSSVQKSFWSDLLNIKFALDILFVNLNQTDPASELQEFAKTNIQIKVGYLQADKAENKNFWYLPAQRSFNLSAGIHIKTRLLVIEKCSKVKISQLLEYAHIADKVLIIENCSTKEMKTASVYTHNSNLNSINYRALAKNDLNEFALANPNINFIQMHIPSLNLRKTFLASINDVFDLVNTQDDIKLTSQLFGWQGIEYNQELALYRPISYIDGVQVFRKK